MPILTVSPSMALSPDVCRRLADELTRITESTLDKKLPLTAVAILLPAQAWTLGAKPLGEDVCSVMVEIRITAGTNSPAQKAAWIAAVWSCLEKCLPAPLSPVSYLNVIEIAANGWGYGGLTQAARAAMTRNAASRQ